MFLLALNILQGESLQFLFVPVGNSDCDFRISLCGDLTGFPDPCPRLCSRFSNLKANEK